MKNKLKNSITLLLLLFMCINILKAQNTAQTINLSQMGTGQILQPMYRMRSEKGANAFNSKFAANATGRNDMNAYLLSYLSTAVYAEKILELENPTKKPSELEPDADKLQLNSGNFLTRFKKVMCPYFSPTTEYTGADIRFFESVNAMDGYDPEGIIIPTANAIFVAFRGTDRVKSDRSSIAGEANFQVREWIQTDFQANNYQPGRINGIKTNGVVHQGMWLSLMKVAEDMALRIKELDGEHKKVWITGHSLGGGLAHLFSYYLTKTTRIRPQGIYVYASPQVGNSTFNNDFDTTIGGANKLQRIEFLDDPITAIAQAVGYAPMGTRISYPNIDHEWFDVADRNNNEVARICASSPLFVPTILKNIPVLGGICFHQQNWYLQAAYKQLTPNETNGVPNSLPIPDKECMGCSSGIDIDRAVNYNAPQTAVVNAILDVTENIINTIGVVAANITGTAFKTGVGTYKITCLNDGKDLAAQGTTGQNGKPIILWQEDGGNNMRFEVFKKGSAYGLKMKGTNRVLDVREASNENGARVQIWDNNLTSLPFQNNQIWYFYNVGGNKYVLQNEKSKKVLDADNASTSINGCEVMQWDYRANAKNQVWIFEKD